MFKLALSQGLGLTDQRFSGVARLRNRLRANLLRSDACPFLSNGYSPKQSSAVCVREFGLTFFRIHPGPGSRMILKNRNRPGSTFPMRIDALFAFLILIFWGFSGLGIAAPAPFAVSLDGNIVHIASGFSFPNKIGDFQRVMARQYEATGRDVSVGYNNDKSQVAATIFLYPSRGRLLETEFVVRENEIVAQHQGTKLVDRGTALITPKKTSALMANYEYTDTFAGRVQLLRSRLVVAQRGEWDIEYRFTYPASEGVAGASMVDFLQKSFVWPETIQKGKH
jgi:hypothetical protein